MAKTPPRTVSVRINSTRAVIELIHRHNGGLEQEALLIAAGPP